MTDSPISIRHLTPSERLIVDAAGGHTVLAGKLLAIRNAMPEVLTTFQMVAIARCVRYSDQIADESIGNIWREDIAGLMETLS